MAKDGVPEIGDNVWHFLYKGGWIDSFPDRKHVSVEFYRDAMKHDPMRQLERDELANCWTNRYGGCWYIDL